MSRASERELQPGQVIADRYRLEAPIGRGAMGAVWRAVHVRLESPVAIKVLNGAIAGDPDMLERFMREARSAAAVRSSHVVQIFDYGVDGGMPYIAMELLLGEPLDERLAARGVLAPPELDKVFGEVARAVSVAHELGVVHRDIKPANIFIAREGGLEVTKVLDFGIAKLIDRQLEAPIGSGTHTGIILGTPNYMSPEQARGHRRVDHRSDL
jgi:serine/threonine protein kinase